MFTVGGYRKRGRTLIGMLTLIVILLTIEAWGLYVSTSDPYGLSHAPPISPDDANSIVPLYGKTWTPDASLDWSPDGSRLALGGGFLDEVIIIDPFTGRTLQRWPVPGLVNAVRWSPDGRLLAVGADKGIDGPGWVFLYTDRGSSVQSWAAHSRSIGDLAWSPNVSWLATTANAEYAIWKVPTGSRLRLDSNASALGFSVSWSPDGRRLAFGDIHGGPSIYDAITGELLHEASYSGFLSAQVVWSPQGGLIAAGLGNGWIRLVDADGAFIADVAAIDHRGESFTGEHVSWSPDGRLVALAASEGISLVHLDSLSVERLLVFPVSRFRNDPSSISGDVFDGSPLDRAVAWSPRGNVLAATGTTTHPSFRMWGIRNTPISFPFISFGLIWALGLGLLLRDDLRLIVREPDRAPEKWLREDPLLSSGLPLLTFALVSSLLVAFFGHAVDRVYGLQPMPPLSWFVLNSLVSIPFIVVPAAIAVKTFHVAIWPSDGSQPFRRRKFRVFGMVLLPFIWTTGLAVTLLGIASLTGLTAAYSDDSLALLVGTGVLLGWGFYLAGRTTQGLSRVEPLRAWWGLGASALVSIIAFFALAFAFLASLILFRIPPPGEFGFQLLFGFGFTPLLLVVIAIAAGLVTAGLQHLTPPLLAAYSRIRGREVLRLETRRNVMFLVETNPGIHFRELLRLSGLGSGTLHYHLSVLEREGLVVAKRDGLLKRFFPAGKGD